MKNLSTRSFYKLFILGLFICLGFNSPSYAQNTTYEFWPELNFWYRIHPSWRLSSYVAITKYNETKYRDLNLTLQADYSWGKTKMPFYKRFIDVNRVEQVKGWMTRGGIMKGKSIGENSGAYSEEMLFAEIHKRSPLKGNVLFSQRFRVDTRWIGDDAKFSYRFRYRFILEKEYQEQKFSITPYINIEPYWDSRFSTFSRIRIIGGATLVNSRVFAIESNITYQYDSKSDYNNLLALNVILHMYFERNITVKK